MQSSPAAGRPLYTGQLARLAGVSPDTIRYYERRALLSAPRRTAAGYRVFPAEAVARLRLVRAALAVGFSVRELAAILRERDRGGAPCRRVRHLAARKLAAVETHLGELQRWRRELRRTLARWDGLLEKAGRGNRAGLLDALAASPPAAPQPKPRCGVLAAKPRRRERGS